MNNPNEDGASQAENPVAAAAENAAPETQKSENTYVARKNGRNRKSGGSKKGSGSSNDSAAACGLVEDMSAVSEKLSGGGHSDKRREFRRRDEEREAPKAAEAAETNGEAEAASEESVSEGPKFDVSTSAQKTFDVSLDETKRSRPPYTVKQPDFKKAEISYSGGKAPREGLLSRIKSMLSGLFGSKKKAPEKKEFSRDRRDGRRNDKNFRRRDGKDGNFNREGGNRDRRGGKNFHGRKNGGNRRPNGQNRDGNRGGKPAGDSAPKGGE